MFKILSFLSATLLNKKAAPMFASADFKAISKNLHSDTSEEQIIEFVQAIKDIPSQNMLLVPLLAERHALYKNKGANQVSRIRGYILSTFEKSGLPDGALPFVLEDLENSRSAYIVAAAAKALRGIKSPTVQVVPYLLKAIINIRYIDDAVTFETYKPQWPLENYTFALKEIFYTFQWLGAYAKGALDELGRLIDEDTLPLSSEITTEIKKAITCITEDQREVNICCELPARSGEAVTRSTTGTEQIADTCLEDQNGESLSYNKFFTGLPAVVAFFYTRCNNPNKCSLTVTKMGHLQKALKAEGLQDQLKTAVVTYDP